MAELIREASELEHVVAPFIDAANTTHWKHALNILYLNGAVLEITEDINIPCLISQTGSTEAVEESIDLLLGKSQRKLLPLLTNIAKLFLPKILRSAKEKNYRTENDSTEDFQTALLTAKLAMEITQETEKYEKELTKLLIQSSFAIPSLIAAGLFRTLSEMRMKQTSCGISEKDYEKMITALSRLDLIEPVLQVSICSKCANYQIIISTCPIIKDRCPKCGEEWTTQTIYMFKGELSQIKAKNQDLPLFISSYLKFKTSIINILTETHVYPNAQVKLITPSEQQELTEVDVFVPDIQVGIECKAYTDPTSPMTTQKLNGMAGDIAEKHIKKYAKAGIKRIFLVTNLPESHAQKLETTLKNLIENKDIKLEELKVIPGEINKLLRFLDQLSENIVNRTSAFLTERTNSTFFQDKNNANPSLIP